MKVTEKDVAYVADLANLQLSAAEQSGMLRDLNSILEYVDRLNELDTSNVEPVAQVSQMIAGDNLGKRAQNADREDILHGLRESLTPQVALGNAPDSNGTFLLVPKVIER